MSHYALQTTSDLYYDTQVAKFFAIDDQYLVVIQFILLQSTYPAISSFFDDCTTTSLKRLYKPVEV